MLLVGGYVSLLPSATCKHTMGREVATMVHHGHTACFEASGGGCRRTSDNSVPLHPRPSGQRRLQAGKSRRVRPKIQGCVPGEGVCTVLSPDSLQTLARPPCVATDTISVPHGTTESCAWLLMP